MSNPSAPDDRPGGPGPSDQAPPPPPPQAPAPGGPPPGAGWGQAPSAPPPQQNWQGGPGGPMAPYGAAPMTDAQARQWAMFAHLSALLGVVLGGLTFVGPLVIWLMKKDENPFVADQAREALNFNITVTIAFIVSYLLMLVVIGFLTATVVGIAWLILTIMAAMAANNGQQYRYPWTLRLVT